MSSIVQPLAWKRYLRSCASLGYQHEATVETNLLQQYNTLYTRYCQDNGLQFHPSTNLDSDVDIQILSEVLYLFHCEKLDSESVIQIRRNISMLTEQVHHQLDSDKFYHVGSTAEGFKISTSDVGHMIVFSGNVVINNITETSELLRAKLNEAVITMETQHTNPGFVRLILETDESTTCERISSSCHNYNDKLYISSTKFREYHMSSFPKSTEFHGPCTKSIHGLSVHDMAVCLSCTSQPTAFRIG